MGAGELSLTPIGFGAFKIGRNTNIKYAAPYPLPDDETAERLLNAVLDLGINYIDTAPAYGVSEERIGRFISHRRSEFFLSTKVGETFLDGRSTYDFSESAVRASVENSLRRLRTDAIDCLFVHAPRDDLQTLTSTGVVPALQQLRDAGCVRNIGLSGYTDEAFDHALNWADAIMIEYHPDCRTSEASIANAASRGLSVIVKKPLASGRLDPAQALAFVLSNPGVTSAVVGSLNIDHLRDNLAAAGSMRASVPARTDS